MSQASAARDYYDTLEGKLVLSLLDRVDLLYAFGLSRIGVAHSMRGLTTCSGMPPETRAMFSYAARGSQFGCRPKSGWRPAARIRADRPFLNVCCRKQQNTKEKP